MNGISICSELNYGTTAVPNWFIDNYMPTANGAYVKVYLYLLRCLSAPAASVTVSSIAESLDETEKDILRAFKYWEKEALLSLSLSGDTIDGVLLLLPPTQAAQESKAEAAAPLAPSATEPEDGSGRPQEKPAGRPSYSPAQIAQLSENEDVKFLLNSVELYLQRLLKPDDIQFILYLYESIGFSKELILHLYDYCISKNKKSLAYIEKVALSWADSGIDTVEKAEQATVVYETCFNAVNKAFGLNRTPGSKEQQYIKRWGSYNFPVSIIEEACSRALLQTGKPSFEYADSILKSWKEKNVTSLSDVAKLDAAHEKTAKKETAALAPQRMPARPVKQPNNRFNSFPQREYSTEDIASLEQRLLNRPLNP